MTFCSTVPGNITGVMLMCEVMDQINQCTVQWDVSFTYLCMYVRAVCIITFIGFLSGGHEEDLLPPWKFFESKSIQAFLNLKTSYAVHNKC